MTVKLVLLKSGEDIIADVQEMVIGAEENRKVIGYFFNKPCIVKMRDPSIFSEEEVEEKDGKKAAYQVALFPWMPLTKDNKIPVAADWVVTITEPIDKLRQMYVQDVINHGKENDKDTSTDEQLNPDFTD
jgi:hypothetical protein